MSFQNSSLYEERLELYNDPDFDRKYYIPLDKRQEFLRNKEFDVEYYKIRSLHQDFKIIFQTIKKVFMNDGVNH